MACKLAVHGPRCVTEGSFMRQAPYQTVTFPVHSSMHPPADISHHKDNKALTSQMAASFSTEKASPHWLKVSSQDAASQSTPGDGGGIRQNSEGARPRAHARLNLHVHFVDVAKEQQKEERDLTISRVVSDLSASASSSIGQASVDSACAVSSNAPSEEMEVQSRLRSPLDQMSSLEDSLPVKRGLSNFFSGKSRSFPALSAVNSMRDLEKAGNPYAKKRKWLHGHGKYLMNRTGCPPWRSSRGAMTKNFLASAKCGSGKKICGESSRAFLCVPHNIFSSRSYSLIDLHSPG